MNLIKKDLTNMERNSKGGKIMVQVNKKFFIDADIHQFILKEKTTVKDKESENYGKEIYNILGYYGTMESAIKGLQKILLRREVMSKDMNLKEVVKAITRINDEVTKIFKEEK